MKRIDTINARENMFGIGKSGFHDNADLPGQDATYVSPEWFNTVQEELCNLLELRGITLNPASKHQLYDLLTTQADLEALADEIETNFVRKNQIVDNLTTNDPTKVVSARTVKELQDNKLDKTALNNTLTSTSNTQALTAAQGKVLNDQAFGVGQNWMNVKSERSLGTTYTNTTGKPIYVIVVNEFQNYGDPVEVFVNNIKLLSVDKGVGVGWLGDTSFVVPAGQTYKVTKEAYPNIQSWVELR
ncbi:MAG: hypothetical protein L0F97_05080 [Acinetobacter sp.]|nr:hypothetical protein [Acinetobacter sp.]